MEDTINYWRHEYKWRDEEALLDHMPQYTARVDVEDFGVIINLHFVHSPSSVAGAVPLPFLHGWPGSFAEVGKVLPKLNKAGFLLEKLPADQNVKTLSKWYSWL